MTDDKNKRRSSPDNIRNEPRHEPSKFLPRTYLFLEDSEQPVVGITRDESDHGFSASFDYPVPVSEGELVDVRVGSRRVWAEVVWVRDIMEKKSLVGFRFHSSKDV